MLLVKRGCGMLWGGWGCWRGEAGGGVLVAASRINHYSGEDSIMRRQCASTLWSCQNASHCNPLLSPCPRPRSPRTGSRRHRDAPGNLPPPGSKWRLWTPSSSVCCHQGDVTPRHGMTSHSPLLRPSGRRLLSRKWPRLVRGRDGDSHPGGAEKSVPPGVGDIKQIGPNFPMDTAWNSEEQLEACRTPGL